MDENKEIGKIERIQFEWKIADFFKLTEDGKYLDYASPTFSVADASLCLKLWPNWNVRIEFVRLYLRSHKKRKHTIEYYFGLKKIDGSMEHLLSGILEGHELCSDDNGNFIAKTELLKRKSELVPGNVLTIICTLKLKTVNSQSVPPTVVKKLK